MVNPENIHTSNIIQTEQVIFRDISEYIIIISEKRGHKFEREQGKIHGSIWREEREGKNIAIIS